jgi:lipoprotein-releasing system ATP-binding protein
MSKTERQIILSAEKIFKTYQEGVLKVEVLCGISLEISSGEVVGVVGPSGSGKSTLLHLLGGLDYPTSGKVILMGFDLSKVSEKEKGILRNQYLGFVYQFHHLLPEFSALENVAMPLLIAGKEINFALDQAHAMLDKVGLAKRTEHRLSELSGGERQRVAIARALITKPQCVLADEPTGNLDHKTAAEIYDLLFDLNQKLNVAFLIVTHDLSVVKKMGRVLVLEDGRIK